MKKLMILALLLSSCSLNQKDPTCLNGYLVYSKDAFMGFCRYAYVSQKGIVGYDFFDGPMQGSRAKMDLAIRDGFVGKTSCYNILSRESK